MTQEGPSAYSELIQFLKTAKSLDPLEHNADLSRASWDHVADIGPRGITGH